MAAKKLQLDSKSVDLGERKSAAMSKKPPYDFNSLFEYRDHEQITTDLTADLQAISNDEVRQIEDRIRAEYKGRFDAYRTEASPYFYFCVCFQNETQKEEFLKAMGLPDDLYLDGLELAKRFGIDIQPVKVTLVNSFRKSAAITKRKEVTTR